MNIYHLETYIEVVKMGCFSKAAQKLHLSQPSVSLQIQKLEHEMKCRLINRAKGEFSLTREGKRFFRFAEYVCHEHKNMSFDLAQMSRGITGNLNILATSVIGEFLLPSIINEFRGENPSIEISIQVADSFTVIGEIQTRDNLVGFCGLRPNLEGLEAVKIGEDEQVLIVYPGHPFSKLKEVTLADLMGESLILRAEPKGIRREYQESLLKAGFDIDKYQPKLIMGTTAGVLSAVEARAGIAIISNLAVRNAEAMGLFKVIRVKNFKVKRDLFCIYRKLGISDSISRDFIEFMSSHYQLRKN